jgi:hypothetical protein
MLASGGSGRTRLSMMVKKAGKEENEEAGRQDEGHNEQVAGKRERSSWSVQRLV